MLGVVYLLGLKGWFKPVCVWAPSGFPKAPLLSDLF